MTAPVPAHQPSNALFDESQIEWTPASSRYLQVKLLGGLLGWGITLAICLVPLVGDLVWEWSWWPPLVCGLPSLVLVWAIIDLSLTARRVRAIGYSEQSDHLLIRQGIWVRRVMAVPYGRMQYVEVNIGPVARLFGLAELELHTAAVNMTAKVVGTTEDDAQRLRAVLTERGEEKMVAL